MMNVLKITISALCIFLCMACSDKGPSAEELLNNPQRNVVLNRDSLGVECWLEVEKNETVQICLDSRVREWKTSLTSKVVNDSCFAFIVPTLIGVDTIRVYFQNSDSSHKINLAVGMKYLDFKNEEVLLGFDKVFLLGPEYYEVIDPVKNVSVTGSYLVDKYPVTNCEITQLLWDNIPLDSDDNGYERAWAQRKKSAVHNKKCNTQDSATNTIFLYQALMYANARSLREKLKPYYIFSETIDQYIRIRSEGQYIIGFHDFIKHENKTIYVKVDSASDGYRLPYYDEWMMFARGGDKTNNAPWGNSASYKEVLKHAKFDKHNENYVENKSDLVGQLKPNKYGLYDVFGLVEEHVLFERPGRFKRSPDVKYRVKRLPSNKVICKNNCPSCLKGGRKDDDWNLVDYGFYRLNDRGFARAGFRLIRNIGNNAKWSEVKLNNLQRNVVLNRDSLGAEYWLEVEKNETVQICLDRRVREWKTSLTSKIVNDSCFAFIVPTLIGVDTINVKFFDTDSSHKINLAVGMKYLDFKNEEVLIGYNEFRGKDSVLKRIISNNPVEEDPERLISVTGSYLVDKYPVTNCEITQLMWDSISMEPSLANSRLQKYANQWKDRKKRSTRNKNCMPKDTAACTVFLLQAMKYANARSIREGLKPYYKFSKTDEQEEQKILSKGHYIIGFFDLSKSKDRLIQVTVDKSSDGYRLPYYDEWMIFARGGDKKNSAPWGDSSVTFEEASKYARFDTWQEFEVSEPVGQLLPNGYGLYDIFGLVQEHVLFEEKNPFQYLKGRPSCLKGGDNYVKKIYLRNSYDTSPYWKWIHYGFYMSNYNGGQAAGFRLIRNIGNNAKWSENKTVKSNSDRSSPKGKVEIDKSEILVESLSLKLGTDSKPNADSAVVRKDNVLLAGFVPVTSSNIVYGDLQENGTVAPENPAIPLINAIPNDWIRSYFANSNFARVAKVYVEKSPKTRKKSLKVRLNLWKKDKTPYDVKPVNLVLYRNGEEKGYYIYQTMTNSKGKPLLFTKNEDDAGNYEDAVILCIKDSTDRFYYELLK